MRHRVVPLTNGRLINRSPGAGGSAGGLGCLPVVTVVLRRRRTLRIKRRGGAQRVVLPLFRGFGPRESKLCFTIHQPVETPPNRRSKFVQLFSYPSFSLSLHTFATPRTTYHCDAAGYSIGPSLFYFFFFYYDVNIFSAFLPSVDNPSLYIILWVSII